MTATPRPIAADDDLADAWIYAGTLFHNADDDWHYENRITVCVTKNAGSSEPQDFHFNLHPAQAVELAQRLLELAAP
jgi:hypothetical protein